MSTTRYAVGLTAAALLLGGCGTASPGVAAQVGDDEITVREVDALASEYCSAFEEQFTSNGEVVPQHYLRGGILGLLVRSSAAEQLADEYDVEAGATYDEKVASTTQGTLQLPEEVREAIITVETAGSYVEAIQAAVGERILTEESGAAPEYTETVERGEQAFTEWLDDHEVEIDPQFGIQVDGGQVGRTDTTLSFPVSDAAVDGAAEAPDPAYSASLPDAQRCG